MRRILSLVIFLVIEPSLHADILPRNYHGVSTTRFLKNTPEYQQYDFFGHVQKGLGRKIEVYKIDPNKPLHNLYKFDRFDLLAVKKASSDSNTLQNLRLANPIESPIVASMTRGRHALNYLGPVAEHDSTGIKEKTQYFRVTGIKKGVIFVSLDREECVTDSGRIFTRKHKSSEITNIPESFRIVLDSALYGLKSYYLSDSLLRILYRDEVTRCEKKYHESCKDHYQMCDSSTWLIPRYYLNAFAILDSLGKLIAIEIPANDSLHFLKSDEMMEDLRNQMQMMKPIRGRFEELLGKPVLSNNPKPFFIVSAEIVLDNAVWWNTDIFQFSKLTNKELAYHFRNSPTIRAKFKIPEYKPKRFEF